MPNGWLSSMVPSRSAQYTGPSYQSGGSSRHLHCATFRLAVQVDNYISALIYTCIHLQTRIHLYNSIQS